MSLLCAKNVGKTYYSRRLLGPDIKQTALTDISLAIAAGETVALLGRSGCGKSTLARLLCGLEPQTKGEILFEGTSLKDLHSPDILAMRCAVQMVFQDSPDATNPRLTIGHIIAEPLRHLTTLNRKQRQKRIIDLLAMVELPAETINMHPPQLSGGQLQRVCIARALAPSPKLVILDEAVSNLDLHLQANTLALLKKIQKENGIACLFVTHDLRLVEKFAARVLVMDQGKIVDQANSGALSALSHPASQQLRDAILPPFPIRHPAQNDEDGFDHFDHLQKARELA